MSGAGPGCGREHDADSLVVEHAVATLMGSLGSNSLPFPIAVHDAVRRRRGLVEQVVETFEHVDDHDVLRPTGTGSGAEAMPRYSPPLAAPVLPQPRSDERSVTEDEIGVLDSLDGDGVGEPAPAPCRIQAHVAHDLRSEGKIRGSRRRPCRALRS